MNEVLLEAANLSRYYPLKNGHRTAAVEDVSFSVRKGECLGIIGESGSGKTTLVQMIAGLLPPSGGSITLDGQPVRADRPGELRLLFRKMQMVFQDPTASFDPRKTLGYGIAEPLRNGGLSKAEAGKAVKELLLRCGLPAEIGARYPHQVSGGQCQRAAIARAIAVRPQLLICDEATSALDTTVQKQILDLLQRIRQEDGLTILFISHDIALVQQFCERILVMHQGRIVEEGIPWDVISHPVSTYTKKLISSVL